MSQESLNTLRDYLLVTLQPSDMHWLGEILIKHSKAKAPLPPYTMEEINAMMDEAELQFESGEYHTNDEVFERLYKKYGIRNEELEETV